MRSIRAAVVVACLLAALPAQAFAYTPQQINVAVAQKMVGSSFSGGPNVQAFVHRNLPRHEAQLVINDCSTNPKVGRWVFFQGKIKVWDCSSNLLLAPPIPIPRDYHTLGVRTVTMACNMIRFTANNGQPYGQQQRVWFPCNDVTAYNGLQSAGAGTPIGHVEVDYACRRSHSHDVLSRVVLTSDGRLIKYWCDWSSRTLYGRHL